MGRKKSESISLWPSSSLHNYQKWLLHTELCEMLMESWALPLDQGTTLPTRGSWALLLHCTWSCRRGQCALFWGGEHSQCALFWGGEHSLTVSTLLDTAKTFPSPRPSALGNIWEYQWWQTCPDHAAHQVWFVLPRRTHTHTPNPKRPRQTDKRLLFFTAEFCFCSCQVAKKSNAGDLARGCVQCFQEASLEGGNHHLLPPHRVPAVRSHHRVVLIKLWLLTVLSQKPEEMLQRWTRLWHCGDLVSIRAQPLLLLHKVSSAGLHSAGQCDPVPALCHFTHHQNQQRHAVSIQLWNDLSPESTQLGERVSSPLGVSRAPVGATGWVWGSWTQKTITKRRQGLAVSLSCLGSLCQGPCTDYLHLKTFWTQTWQWAQNPKPALNWAIRIGTNHCSAHWHCLFNQRLPCLTWKRKFCSKNASVESSTSYKLQQMNAIILHKEYINIDDRYITHINIE